MRRRMLENPACDETGRMRDVGREASAAGIRDVAERAPGHDARQGGAADPDELGLSASAWARIASRSKDPSGCTPYGTRRQYWPEMLCFQPCERWPPAARSSPITASPGWSSARWTARFAILPEYGWTLAYGTPKSALARSCTSVSVDRRHRCRVVARAGYPPRICRRSGSRAPPGRRSRRGSPKDQAVCRRGASSAAASGDLGISDGRNSVMRLPYGESAGIQTSAKKKPAEAERGFRRGGRHRRWRWVVPHEQGPRETSTPTSPGPQRSWRLARNAASKAGSPPVASTAVRMSSRRLGGPGVRISGIRRVMGGRRRRGMDGRVASQAPAR